ncbi:MAG: FAD-dependent oxidoreductase [Dehalococcoidia bacterium]
MKKSKRERKSEAVEVSRRSFMQRAGTGLVAGAFVGGLPTSVALGQSRSWDQEVDVLVLGSGAAGTAAALAAAQSGSRVLVLERAPNQGGSSRRSGGVLYLGGGTPPQVANGFDDTPDNMYNYLVRAMGVGADEARIRAYSDGSVDLYNWLVDVGLPFNNKYNEHKITITEDDTTLYWSGSERSYPYTEYATPVPRGHKTGVQGGSTGYALMDVLYEAAEQAGVEFRFNTRAVDLIEDGDRVVGVVAQDTENGSEQRFGARGGVVVTTGGFQFNQDLVALHCPQYINTAAPLGAPEEDGDGLTMGQRIGAQVVNLDRGSPWKFIYPPDAMVKSLLVSPLGTRFITEDIYGGNSSDMTMRHYDGISYLIYDEAIRQEIGDHAERLNPIAQADTVAGLAEQLNVPVSALENTVDFYNQHAGDGEDPLFHKKSDYVQPLSSPPYYALDFSGPSGMAWITLGGLRIDPNGRVMNVDGEVIPGLYAAGRAGAALGGIYNSGTSLGDCVFFGREAGRQAASESPTASHRRQVASKL